MKRAGLVLLGALFIDAAGAAAPAAADPGIYGPIDTAKFPKPQLVSSRPVIADRARLPKGARLSTAKPLYLHVPPREVSHWQAHCATYNACGVPVLFVSENWFVKVYLPAIGAMDGREQRYLEQMGRDREAQRDLREERSDD